MAFLAAPATASAQGARRDDGEKEDKKPAPKLTKAPKVIEATAPDYPPEAAKAGLEAVVKVRLHIDATGAVTKVDVVEPVGNGFDEAAQKAALQYKFEPAEFDGVPGPIVVETKINFEITVQDVEPPPPPPPVKDPDKVDPKSVGPPAHGGDYRQPVVLKGTALERGTRRKLAGVIVSVTQLGIDAITDKSGAFFFHGLPPGEYDVIAVADGFDRFRRTVKVANNEEVSAKLYMRPRGGNPYQTIVEGEREVIEVTRRTIDRRQMTSVPGTFGDPIRVIQTLPSVGRTPFNTGFLIIRGGNPDDSGVFIDGHQVPLLFHLLGGPSILNAEFLDKIDLYPGGFPARYGRFSGGVVSVETRSAKSDGVHGSADADLLDAGAYVRFPVGDNGALAFAGRRSYLDFVLGFFLPEEDPGQTLLVVPVYFDYQSRLDYDLEKHGKLTVFALGSGDRLNVLSEDQDAEQSFQLNSQINFFRLITTYTRPLTDKFDLTISPAIGRDSIKFAGGDRSLPNAAEFTLKNDVASYRMRVKGKPTPWLLVDVGLDLDSRVTTYSILGQFEDDNDAPDGADTESREVSFTANTIQYAAHADVAVDIGKLRLIPGLRLDGFNLNGQDKFSVDPRLVARYTFDKTLVAKGYLGLFHQPPQPEALDVEFGNPAVGLERALHYGVGAEWKFAKNWLVDGEVYAIDRRNQVRFTSRVEDDGTPGGDPVIFENVGKSDTIGLEVLLRREITRKLYGWLSYTLSRTLQNRNVGTPDERITPGIFDQRHILNAVASYRTDNGWELGARFRLTSGRPITSVVSSTFDADSGDYVPVEGEQLGDRRPLFQQFDVRAEKKWLLNTWSIGVYLDIQNVLNASNEEGLQYDYRYRETSPIVGIPFLPTLGVQGKW